MKNTFYLKDLIIVKVAKLREYFLFCTISKKRHEHKTLTNSDFVMCFFMGRIENNY